MPELPPGSRIPQNLTGIGFIEIVDYQVGSWCPTPDGSGPATQVHVQIRLRGIPDPLVLRFKSPESLDTLIAALQRHRADVWPVPGRQPKGGA